MLFRKKGRLKKQFDEKLLQELNELRSSWAKQKSLLEKSFDPSYEVIYHAKITEAKYLFLIKEAKFRKVRL